ncbi:MAG: PLP-dependent transferase [Candidatus Marinimicrobia bacterium]|jgi:cystathionine beta-lyase/cystathionine gamma-synthase|nr:PLP-dependent transferase [Candidatus Neomarinimicrobiota bacterium]MBT3936544.1 PLP-dependent transferase [Candidatus Neomarinimicrobiota bacterium]MBT3961391.1 PLP-dependent transferase [Candidatus Neomarinimicrobiota bacterium]MBT4382755.1 PLP-dependent transferase [Candidatus Neomarinimicrobiota bacterium]MBT4636616.1 PLP-dependent transferase [Candidatus Neomarinimicrobiota bacterium]
MKKDTLIVRGKIQPDPTTGAIIPPIYQTATYALEEVGKDKGFDYTRSANPTRQTMEEYLAIIEGGKYGVAFSSGMAAVDSCLKLLKAGDHIICSDDVYGGVSRHFNQILNNYNLEFTYVDSQIVSNIEAAIQPNTKMIWIETPTNPLLKITDLETVGRIAKSHNILFGVDSTFATPVFLRPLNFGADLVMHSTTKYLSGHNQLIGGAVITDREDLFESLKFIQKTVGAVPGPFDCWLTLLGLKTLDLRMNKHNENGMEIATYLESHPKVKHVIYPGLESHPMHQIAKEQMSGYSGMISFELKGGLESGKALMNNVDLCLLAESLGAVESMITHPATMTHVDVPKDQRLARGFSDGLVRLSVGIENVIDIISDLEQALEKA